MENELSSIIQITDMSFNEITNNLSFQNTSLSEKAARNIFLEMNKEAIISFSYEAIEIANKRIMRFENRLMHKISLLVGSFEMFGDPWFRIQLLNAQKSAAISDGQTDCDLLSDLLVSCYNESEHAKRTLNRVSLTKAINAVSLLSNDALLGWTIICSIRYFTIRSCGGIKETLDKYEKRYIKILENTSLKLDEHWLDEIYALDMCHLLAYMTIPAFEDDFFISKHNGFVECGIKKDSSKYLQAFNILEVNSISTLEYDWLVTHELNDDYVRLNINSFDVIDKLIDLSDSQKAALHSIISLYEKNDKMLQKNIEIMNMLWKERPVLSMITDFYNSIVTKNAFIEMYTGLLIAEANINRLECFT